MVPVVSAATYDAARHRAAFIDRSHLGRIVVSGRDRASYLQGLLTNDVVALKGGQGCYAAYLTAQGRMIADLWALELGDVTATYAQIGVVGPEASSAVSDVVGAPSNVLDSLPVHGNIRAEHNG